MLRFSAGLPGLGRFSADRVLAGTGFFAGAVFPAAVEAGAGEEPPAEGPAALAPAALAGGFAAAAGGAASTLFLAAGPRREGPLIEKHKTIKVGSLLQLVAAARAQGQQDIRGAKRQEVAAYSIALWTLLWPKGIFFGAARGCAGPARGGHHTFSQAAQTSNNY